MFYLIVLFETKIKKNKFYYNYELHKNEIKMCINQAEERFLPKKGKIMYSRKSQENVAAINRVISFISFGSQNSYLCEKMYLV